MGFGVVGFFLGFDVFGGGDGFVGFDMFGDRGGEVFGVLFVGELFVESLIVVVGEFGVGGIEVGEDFFGEIFGDVGDEVFELFYVLEDGFFGVVVGGGDVVGGEEGEVEFF